MHTQLNSSLVSGIFFSQYIFHVIDTGESGLPAPRYLKKRDLGTIFNKKRDF